MATLQEYIKTLQQEIKDPLQHIAALEELEKEGLGIIVEVEEKNIRRYREPHRDFTYVTRDYSVAEDVSFEKVVKRLGRVRRTYVWEIAFTKTFSTLNGDIEIHSRYDGYGLDGTQHHEAIMQEIFEYCIDMKRSGVFHRVTQKDLLTFYREQGVQPDVLKVFREELRELREQYPRTRS